MTICKPAHHVRHALYVCVNQWNDKIYFPDLQSALRQRCTPECDERIREEQVGDQGLKMLFKDLKTLWHIF